MSTNQARLDVPSVPWAPPRAPGDAPPTDERPAGVWRRGAALVVDGAVVWLLLKLGDLGVAALAEREILAQAFAWSWLLVVPTAYLTLGHGTAGQTLGKRLVRARVVRATGEPIGYPRALARCLAWWLSLLPLGFGFVLAAARRDRRALHDVVAGTRVIRVR